jgi:hypothetical protein
LVPVSGDAIEQAIRLNGVSVERDLAAFGSVRCMPGL